MISYDLKIPLKKTNPSPPILPLPAKDQPWLIQGIRRRDLRSPGVISKHGGFRAPDGDSARVKERETWGDQYFEKLIPILYFPWSTFYTLRCYAKVTWGQQS